MKVKAVQNASTEYVSKIKGKLKRPVLFSVQGCQSKLFPWYWRKNYLSSHLTELVILMRRNMMIRKHKILTRDVRLSSAKKYFS